MRPIDGAWGGKRAMPHTLVHKLHGRESRKALVETVISVLERWSMTQTEQAVLLGLPDATRPPRYRRSEPLADDPDLLERVGHLLAIHRTLKQKFPYRPEWRNRWMRTPDPILDGQSPLEVVRCQGTEGLRRVRRHLDASSRH